MKDQQKIKEIYDRQADRVYRTAMVFMKNSQDAEDIVQSVFLTLIEKDIKFENPEHEKAWFIVTTRNRCKDSLKSYWHKNVDVGSEAVDFSGSMDEDNSDLDTLKTLLMSLPDDKREMLYLHYYEGYTINEVANLMNLKETKIRSGIVSAKKALTKYKQ